MIYEYQPTGVCCRKITFELQEEKIIKVDILGGCNGNLQGICSLIKDQDITTVINKLQGIKCGFKNTSCPDQIAQALSVFLKSEY